MLKTIKQIRDFCRSNYYVNDIVGKDVLWQPFENYSKEDIDDLIDNDVHAMCEFLGVKY